MGGALAGPPPESEVLPRDPGMSIETMLSELMVAGFLMAMLFLVARA